MYKSENMRLMGGVPGQQLFMYRSDDDTSSAMLVPRYFNKAVDEYNLDIGDVIIATSIIGGMASVMTLAVSVKADGTVIVNSER